MANPKGSETVSSVVREELAGEITHLAESSGMSRSRYVSHLLENAARERRVFRVTSEVLSDEVTPYRPKSRK